MIPALIAKQVLPLIKKPIKNWLLKHFKGIEKISYLVDYMENENETDKQVKLHEEALKGLSSEIDELKKDMEKWKKNV